MCNEIKKIGLPMTLGFQGKLHPNSLACTLEKHLSDLCSFVQGLQAHTVIFSLLITG